MYIKKNGNGGYEVSTKLIVILTFLILLLGSVASVVAYSVGVSGSVKAIGEDVDEIKDDVNGLYPRIGANEIDIAVMKEHYESIDKSMTEIKQELKGVLYGN